MTVSAIAAAFGSFAALLIVPSTSGQSSKENPSFSTLSDLFERAGLNDVLRNRTAPVTLFAPSDSAFEAAGTEALEFLASPENTNYLQRVLLGLVFPGNLYSSKFLDTPFTLNSFAGGTSFFYSGDGDVMIDNSTIVETDILTMNGVVHIIDRALPAPSIYDLLFSVSTFTEDALLLDAAAGLFDTAGLSTPLELDNLNSPTMYTCFAPDDQAIAAALPAVRKFFATAWKPQLRELLYYHVVPGRFDSKQAANANVLQSLVGQLTVASTDDGLKVNDANIIFHGIEAYNGVLYAIDKVMVPPNLSTKLDELLLADDSFKNIVDALNTTKLLDELGTEGPITLFAPTSSAFAELLGSLNLTQLPEDFIMPLTDILRYHFIGENVVLQDGASATTLHGADVAFTETDGGFLVNNITIREELLAVNGIIYVINEVLIPLGTELPVNFTLPPAMAPVEEPAAVPTAASAIVSRRYSWLSFIVPGIMIIIWIA